MLRKIFTSRTIVGAAVLGVTLITRAVGLEFDDAAITETARQIVEVGALVAVIVGRLKAKGPLL